jgi:hypothetical protein
MLIVNFGIAHKFFLCNPFHCTDFNSPLIWFETKYCLQFIKRRWTSNKLTEAKIHSLRNSQHCVWNKWQMHSMHAGKSVKLSKLRTNKGKVQYLTTECNVLIVLCIANTIKWLMWSINYYKYGATGKCQQAGWKKRGRIQFLAKYSTFSFS